MIKILRFLVLPILLLMVSSSSAIETKIIEIAIKDHHFEPEIVEAPTNVRIKLIVHNQDKTIEEFESHSLKREKLVPPGKKINVILPPLKPGKYHFFGEFHEETANGYLVIREPSTDVACKTENN